MGDEGKGKAKSLTSDLFNVPLFAALNVCFLQTSLNEVRARRLEPTRTRPEINLEGVDENGLDSILEMLKDSEQKESARRSSVDDKAKVLLSLAALLMTVIGIFSQRVPYVWMALVSLILLFSTLLLLLAYFGVGSQDYVLVDQELIDAGKSDRKALLAKKRMRAQWRNEHANDFLVHVYWAARRAFGVALLSVAAMGAATILAGNDLEGRIITRLRGEQTLIDLLRGPPGPQGQQGPVGLPGMQGLQGPMGPPGVCSCPAKP